MVECPRCGLYMSNFKPECDICGYQPDWEDYSDHNLIDYDSIDKILEFNSIEVLDIIRPKRTIALTIINGVEFCSKCGSVVIPYRRIINCANCGYVGVLK